MTEEIMSKELFDMTHKEYMIDHELYMLELSITAKILTEDTKGIQEYITELREMLVKVKKDILMYSLENDLGDYDDYKKKCEK